MQFIYFIICILLQNIQLRVQYLNCESKIVLNKSRNLLISKYSCVLVSTVSFLWAFLQTLLIYSSNFSSLSIVMSRSLMFQIPKFDHDLFSPHMLCLFPETKRRHLPAFIFILLYSNHFKAIFACCSNYCITKFRFLSQISGAVSLAKII